MTLSYRDKLRDPRWQKMRLAVLSRDEFICTSCGTAESTLHVHHCYYDRGIEPWEYPMSSLITLCEYCHAEESPHGYEGKKALSHAFAQKGIRDSTIGIWPPP